MSDHGYEAGRLNLPFVGISTFGKRPYVADWDAIEADVAILGAPSILAPNGAPVRASVRAQSAKPQLYFLSVMPVPMTMRMTRHTSQAMCVSLIWVMPISSIRKRMKAMPILNLVCARFWPPARCQW